MSNREFLSGVEVISQRAMSSAKRFGRGFSRISLPREFEHRWLCVRLTAGYFNLTSLCCSVFEPIACYSEPGSSKHCVYHLGETADVR